MEVYRFFNSAVGDVREYQAAEFAEYFDRFLSDGLYSENGQVGTQVTAGTGLQISVATGYAFINGYMYHNDTALTKTIEVADGILQRIDRAVIKFDEVAKTITVQIKKGTFASSPVPPTLVDTATVKELSLAQVKVRPGSTSILASDITDERMTVYCGLVSSLIDIPAAEMWDVWNGALAAIQAAWVTDQADVASEWAAQQDAWTTWFASIQADMGLRIAQGTVAPDASWAWMEEV